MKPQTVGRVLGVGLRVAGRMAGQRLAGPGGDSSGAVAGSSAHPNQRQAGRQAGRTSANVARGLGGFVRPFKRVGGILVLEVTGVFFLLFVLVFGQMAWRVRASYAHGPDHQKFLVAGGLALVFLYLTVSSFWRARRR
ncbi:hypothetical protein DYQ86_08095 [Acidobacteria bacterium AB60]|nr:hypothetical protein DYQ86_08095 [Acidobacteria bacterium AB60]